MTRIQPQSVILFIGILPKLPQAVNEQPAVAKKSVIEQKGSSGYNYKKLLVRFQ
jgi:hypothetical protein